jgi:aspartate aminotransferase
MDTPPPASTPAAPLSARLGILAPSATLATVARIRRLQAEGEAILDLTAGEPDFNPPPAAEQAAQEATAAGKGRYTAAAGMMPLRKAVATQLGRDWGLPYEPTQVVVTHGAKLAIAQALMAMLDPGDEVLIPIPSWTSYPEMVKLAGGEPVTVPCRAELLPHVEDLEAARTPRSKVLLLNTPCNPTGVVYPPDCLEALGRWALAHGIRLISDEIYGMLTYGDAVHRSPLALVPELQATSAWVGGMSKTYAMTGWRMGFLAGPPDLAKAVATIQSQLAGSPHAISQIASQAAIEQSDADVARMVAAFARRAALVQEGLAAIPELDARAPEGAFYAWIDCKPILGRRDPATGRVITSGDDFCEVLLEADRVAGMVGSAFGDADFLRLSFATSEEVLAEALARLAARVAALETV